MALVTCKACLDNWQRPGVFSSSLCYVKVQSGKLAQLYLNVFFPHAVVHHQKQVVLR